MPVVTRFAPSPTGFLHIGNARTSIVCSLLVAALGGTYILRIDDTDTERSREEYVDGLKRDLEWLGTQWQGLKRQSERFGRYAECVERMKRDGRLYACYETAEEIEIKRKIALGRGLPPIYDREALRLTEAGKAEYAREGRLPHWRFKLDHDEPIAWDDLIRGRLSFDPAHLSDPVLIRENGTPTYMLPSAVDDADFGITHVVRGEDHISNTAIQLQLFTALGATPPKFAHLSLLKSKEGKISKRKGGNAVQDFREEGVEPETLVSYLSRLGTSQPIAPLYGWKEAAEGFDFAHFSKASCIFDPEELYRLNAKVLHHCPYALVAGREETKGVNEAFWQGVQGNLERLSDVREWFRICEEPIAPAVDEPEFLREAAALLPPEPWDGATWKAWTEEVAKKTSRKGKQLFLPLRRALTARDSGPELAALLPLIGREKAERRLRGETA
jgi:glutamyl-tRNA synthetase